MTQGELEQIPLPFERHLSDLEMRIMNEIVQAIKVNGFSTATADRQMDRMVQLGRSERDIRQCIQETLDATDEEIERIFSDTVYEYYYGYERVYKATGTAQIPFKDNLELQALISAVQSQTINTFRNMTASMGFAIRDPATGKISYSPLMDFYQSTLDSAVLEIVSGTISYDKAIGRAINTMTNSGLRWIDYDSGWHNRVNVAARRAIMAGFRQVQEKINEQVAKDLGTDSYEVSYHVGARPEHQPWQGRVWTYEQLVSVCGLGTVTGLHGANCYHDYNPFIPGVSVRTYTDDQLDEMLEEENRPKAYNGKEYTAYEALQEQRRMETAMRKTRQDIKLLQESGVNETTITVKKARYQVQMQQYKSFSSAMKLPEQMQRVYQDGLGKVAGGRNKNTAASWSKSVAKSSGRNTAEGEKSKKKYKYKKTVVNEKMIDSPDYRKRFNDLSDNPSVNRGAWNAAKEILKHRSGTKYEDLAFIDGSTGKYIINKDYDMENTAKPNKPMNKMLSAAEPYTIIGIHNHPGSSAPSLSDLVVCMDRKYDFGVVACHDGRVYKYSVDTAKFNKLNAHFALERMLKEGYTDDVKGMLYDVGVKLEVL